MNRNFTYHAVEMPPVVIVKDEQSKPLGWFRQTLLVLHIMAAPMLLLIATTIAAVFGRKINYRNSVTMTTYRNAALLGASTGLFPEVEVPKDMLPGCGNPDCDNCK